MATLQTASSNKTKPPVDEYAARMDRMIENLKSQSRTEHAQQNQILWISVAAVAVTSIVICAAIVLFRPEGFQGLMDFLDSGR